MPAIFDYSHTVTEEEIDGLGHANNLAYLKWMQTAAIAHSAAQGWPTERYRDIGAGWVVRSHSIEYLLPAYCNDLITVRTWVSDFKKIQSLRQYRVLRATDDAVLAVAETNWVFISREHHVPRRVPVELRDSFELVPASAEP